MSSNVAEAVTKERLHSSGEDYLKAIFILEAQHGSVRSVEVAECMNVSKASVNHAVRHIILNNQVVNSSRALHSLKHTVPKSHKNIAIHMVDHIRRLGVFPANYALDLGEFIDSNGNSYIDIVELNPISCSMCYVNNSIYADVVPEIGECQRQLMMGAEFCYDAIANPKNYDMLRISNKSYTYTSDNQYALL